MSALAGVELRHLRYFLAVAESGTVTDAARALRIAQPSLSQQIAALEQRIGVTLFRRTSKGVTLTSPGEVLASGARDALARLQAAADAARATPVPVPVGLCAGVPGELLASVDAALRAASAEHHPVPEFEYQMRTTEEQATALRSGALGLGILRLPVAAPDLLLATIHDEPLDVVVHRAHPLASRAAIDWSDLAGQRLLWFAPSRAPGYATDVLAHLHAHGWRPALHTPPSGGRALFVHALRGGTDIVALRPRSAVANDTELRWLPFRTDPPRERLALATAAGGAWDFLLASQLRH
jgi:LysR family transcriptional regulator, benzoate and cis,cis-muconate-responsive activator of ben and cat genes